MKDRYSIFLGKSVQFILAFFIVITLLLWVVKTGLGEPIPWYKHPLLLLGVCLVPFILNAIKLSKIEMRKNPDQSKIHKKE